MKLICLALLLLNTPVFENELRFLGEIIVRVKSTYAIKANKDSTSYQVMDKNNKELVNFSSIEHFGMSLDKIAHQLNNGIKNDREKLKESKLSNKYKLFGLDAFKILKVDKNGNKGFTFLLAYKGHILIFNTRVEDIDEILTLEIIKKAND